MSKIEGESDDAIQVDAAFRIALSLVLAYLSHSDLHTRAGLVNHFWCQTAKKSSPCAMIGIDCAYATAKSDLIIYGSVLDKPPGEFVINNLGSISLFNRECDVQTLMRIDSNDPVVPKFHARVVFSVKAIVEIGASLEV